MSLERKIGIQAKNPVQVTASTFGVTPQAVYRHLHALIDEGVVLASGSGRKRQYSLAVLDRVVERLALDGLEESEVWRRYVQPLFSSLSETTAGQIAEFGFTEMLNNAIDHSEGAHVTIHAVRTAASVHLMIIDDGVGIFRKIAAALDLPDDKQAVFELTKGKFTTDPKRHSGMGIFFTSRACDSFAILSGNIAFQHLYSGRDFLLDTGPAHTQGTTIDMWIDTRTTRRLVDLFDEYKGDNKPGFSRTVLPVSIAEYGDENLVSRSQAKRVLARIDRFSEVLFDFKGVPEIGQAFADEIFRVFQLAHPDVKLLAVNMEPPVRAMVELAIATRMEHDDAAG